MTRKRWVLTILAGSLVLLVPLTNVVWSLRMTRGGVMTFARLVGSANAGDLDAVRSLCTRRYLGSHRVERSPEGGVVGLPRVIHKNFRAWVGEEDVWLCPTDRVGPVYRLVLEGGTWKLDGLAGLLGADGRVVPVAEDSISREEGPAGAGSARPARRASTGPDRGP